VVHQVLVPSNEEIVYHDHTVPSRNQPIYQVRCLWTMYHLSQRSWYR